ncbi:MAG: GGDEF domain-containing protein, partial [Pseudomonadota bacterium]
MVFTWLDFKTMLFMTGVLAVALSILLLAINTRISMLNGLKEWVYANLLIGAAIIIFTQETMLMHIRALFGGLLIVFGLALYFISIRIFEKRPIKRRNIQYAFAALILINLCVTFLSHNEYISVVLNTAICIVLTFVSAVYLLKYSNQKRSAEYQFTG